MWGLGKSKLNLPQSLSCVCVGVGGATWVCFGFGSKKQSLFPMPWFVHPFLTMSKLFTSRSTTFNYFHFYQLEFLPFHCSVKRSIGIPCSIRMMICLDLRGNWHVRSKEKRTLVSYIYHSTTSLILQWRI